MPCRAPSRTPDDAPKPPPPKGQRWLDLVHKLLTGAAALGALVKLLLG